MEYMNVCANLCDTDKTIISLVQDIDSNLNTVANEAVSELAELKKCEDALKAAEKAIEDGKVEKGKLHCDDAKNCGKIRCDSMGGMFVNVDMRQQNPAFLKACISALYAMKLAGENNGQLEAYAEGGHSVEEWIEDLQLVFDFKTGAAMAKNALDIADIALQEKMEALTTGIDKRTSLVGLLSDDYRKKVAIIKAMGGALPIPDAFELPEDIIQYLEDKKAEAEGDENRYDEDEDEDEDEENSDLPCCAPDNY